MNTVTIIGNLTRDAKVVKTDGGKDLIFNTVAVNYKSGDKERTDFIPIKKVGSEKFASYLTKGKKVAVTGRLQSYMKDKQTHVIVAATRVEFLSKKTIEAEPNGDTTPLPEPF